MWFEIMRTLKTHGKNMFSMTIFDFVLRSSIHGVTQKAKEFDYHHYCTNESRPKKSHIECSISLNPEPEPELTQTRLRYLP